KKFKKAGNILRWEQWGQKEFCPHRTYQWVARHHVRQMKIIDPVCGMTIEESNGTLAFSYTGTTYYFCSEKCKEKFVEDPDTVLSMKAEREKIAEEERAKSLEQMMDQVAHEMRNPLTSIGGFTRRIYEGLHESDPNKKYLKMVIEDVARLEGMIKQLIELKAMGEPRMEPVDINEIIGETLRSFERELRAMNIEVKTDLADNPPKLMADRHKLITAVSGLVDNAIEAMENPPKVLRVASSIKDEYMEVVVSDTGKGIPKDRIKYIFDPFFTSKIYGPGLGLTFARRIVQEHEGTISAESELGKGTAFIIRLPLRQPNLGEPPSGQSTGRPSQNRI
ncbi:MAG: ATP-binding protein, partial [Nitrospirota bacterium]